MRLSSLALMLALAGAAPPVALANDYSAGSLTIGHPWSRATPPMARVAGGYLTITNTGAEPDRLVGASSPSAKKVEFHESNTEGGIARMRPLTDGIVIDPGATVALQPGGMHVMFIEPAQPLKVGESFPATLRFEGAGEVQVEFMVQPLGSGQTPHKDHQPERQK